MQKACVLSTSQLRVAVKSVAERKTTVEVTRVNVTPKLHQCFRFASMITAQTHPTAEWC